MKIIADAGATGTEWRISVSEGEILSRRTSGLNFSVSRGERNIRAVVDNLRTELDLPDGEVTEIWFYGAGLVSEDICREWSEALGTVLKCGSVHVASDMVGAARAVLGEETGIACILGTGSNSCLWNGERIVRNVHPGGYILGDEGSGAYMGRMLLSDFIKELTPQPLAGILRERFGLNYGNIVENVYKGQSPSRYLASFAPLLREHINMPYCRNMVAGAFDAFIARNILPYGNDHLPLGFAGSVAAAFSDVLRERVENAGYGVSSIVATPVGALCRCHLQPVRMGKE